MSDGTDATDQPAALRPLTVPRLLVRGMRLQCPVCGQSGLFRRWFTIVERCPRCGFRLDERIEGHWIGSLGLNTIVTTVALFVTMVGGLVATYPDFPAAALAASCVAVAVVVPLVFFPFSKTLWSAIDLAMRPLEPDDDVDPRWIPPPVHRRH